AMAVGFYSDYYLPRCAPLTLDDLNVDYRGRLTLCCQLSNYRDGQDEGEDVIGDLKKEPLSALLSRLMGLVNQVHRERLEMAKDGAHTEEQHYPCLACIGRFKKTSEQPMLVQIGLKEA